MLLMSAKIMGWMKGDFGFLKIGLPALGAAPAVAFDGPWRLRISRNERGPGPLVAKEDAEETLHQKSPPLPLELVSLTSKPELPESDDEDDPESGGELELESK